MDRECLVGEMTERFQELYGEALDALEKAPDGRWIADTEFVFRDVFHKLMNETYQRSLQEKIETHPTAEQAAFFPGKPRDGRTSEAQE